MAALKNGKQENFAKGLVQGHSAGVAYALAGYKRSDAAASRMSRNVKVAARVAELKEKVAEKVIITEAELLNELKDVALSKPTEEPTYANKLKAIELSGDHIGMFGKNRGPGSVTVQLILTEDEFKY
jgi:phage terminase small subunit